jgi:hypothetical protein
VETKCCAQTPHMLTINPPIYFVRVRNQDSVVGRASGILGLD